MSPQALPSEIVAFIGDHLISVDEIDAMTAMNSAPTRWWDAKLICGELGIPIAVARAILDHLGGLNLLDIRVTDEVRYRFRPGTPQLNRIISRLLSLYRSDRAAVLRAVARVTRRGVLDIADAFRLRKDVRD